MPLAVVRRDLGADRRVLQRLLDGADPFARQERDHVLDRALLLADLRGRGTLHAAVRLADAELGGELAALIAIGIFGGLAHIFLTESYRLAEASLVAPFDYTSMLWALVLGYLVFSELPGWQVFAGAAIIAAAGLFVIWRERQLGLQRARAAESPPAAT